MITYFSRFGLLLILLFITISCAKSTEREPPPVTPLPLLNEFVKTAPYQYLNIDEAEVFEIILGEEDIIFDVNQEVNSDDPILGQISYFTYGENVFYVYDRNNESIFIVNKEGRVKGPLTRNGSGPSEHLVVGQLLRNTHYVYVTDKNNGRINKYLNDMGTAGALDGHISNTVALNDEKILVENRNNAWFSPLQPNQGVIAISSIDNLSDTLATILPRIIPPGYQPGVYNDPSFSINSKNKVAARYKPLPWIFLFDDKNNFEQTLILEYSVFDEMNIPAMDLFKPKGNEGFGGAMPITQSKIMDNGDLFISIRRELIHLVFDDDRTYKVSGKYRFKIDDQDLWVADLFQSEDREKFYAGNWEYLFQFELD